MHIEEHKSLKKYNTFSIDCSARYFVSIESIKDLKKVLKQKMHPNIFILGGGSNMLLTQDIDAFVIHINLKGIETIYEDQNSITLKVMAGENWHDFVQYCIQNNYGGIENLSLIPGNVGTAPIQNIGAYGVELKDVIKNCQAISVNNLSNKIFTKEECKFGYRNSIFKNEEKGKYIITSVTFELTKINHKKNIDYGAIKEELNKQQIENPSLKQISEAVIKIRQSKLPDPKELGNSGSFFKNPIINKIAFKQFHDKYPKAPYYKLSNSEYKIPAGWLIEQAEFKGIRIGDAGVHKKQALVLVNYGNATGQEILSLSNTIQNKVKKVFGITIEPEVNII